MAAVFGGTVEDVLDSPRIEPAPATLEEARNAPGRDDKIQAIVKRIEDEGIKYVFFQQVSITGRVMGKGVVSSFFSQVAKKGYQLVYGATANLFTDRYGNYIGFGPEESELAAIADLDTFEVLPWDNRVARVYCDCYDTETGELMDADPRQNLKRIAHDFEQELGYRVPDRDRARDDVAAQAARGRGAPGRHASRTATTSISSRSSVRCCSTSSTTASALGLDMSYGDHEDAPGQLELNFRFDRPLRTADNITTYRQICAAVGRKHDLLPTFMPKPFTGVSANGHHHHFTLMDKDGNNVFHDPDGPAQLSQFARHFLGGMLEHFPALMCVGNPTVNSYCRMWDTGLLGADLQELGLAEPHDDGPRRVRRPVRVPRRRLQLQPVSDRRDAAACRAGRRAPRDRPGAAAAGQHLRPAGRGRGDREGARQPRQGAGGAGRPTTSSSRRCPAASTRSFTTTSATSGSATWRPSPTGSVTSTWRSSPDRPGRI